MKQRVLWTLLAASVMLIPSLAACGSSGSPATDGVSEDSETSEPGALSTDLQGELTIFHAGSLTVPMQALTEAFESQHSGATVQTEASGSREAARKISELGREADLMVSSDYTVIAELLVPELADWYVQFARNTMVVAYTESSAYADEITGDNWYEILTRSDVVFGRGDHDVDPCGYRTLMVWQLAEKHYNVPGLYTELDAFCPVENVRPTSEGLLALLQSGDMDYAFEYRSVAVQHGLKFVELPDEVNLSRVEYADLYSEATVEVSGAEPGSTVTQAGKPIVYGVTIPMNAPSPALAIQFVRFLIGPQGQAIMEQQGQPPVVPPVASDRSALPFELQALTD